ncbi:L,D-transpeptidase [Mesorhizobium sp. BR1-1-9]|uniref:L,D-transpeptidase n=1 Tax=unclassified Mesorhizobium TaxID=325217 RepID=UPI001CD17A90|nr:MULTISPECIES: L,D-transpeptidase [unclassified Mesorhizobium]MBZ9873197.1 L,D-transpeptidase [Mesorhizobium sp. BR1-1-9]
MMTRRAALMIMGAGLVSGCVTRPGNTTAKMADAPIADPSFLQMYAALDNEPFPVPAVDLKHVDPKYWRREVAYPTQERPGTVVVDPGERHAYLVMEGGKAIRYGVGVGKQEAFNFRGDATVARKAAWPRWTPTQDMIRREPDRYTKYAGGLPGGYGNPLGPRALYLYRDGEDTLYRLHGTVEPWTIGKMVSSGCVRFLNQDIIDLYGRVPVGSKVVVLPASTIVA